MISSLSKRALPQMFQKVWVISRLRTLARGAKSWVRFLTLISVNVLATSASTATDSTQPWSEHNVNINGYPDLKNAFETGLKNLQCNSTTLSNDIFNGLKNLLQRQEEDESLQEQQDRMLAFYDALKSIISTIDRMELSLDNWPIKYNQEKVCALVLEYHNQLVKYNEIYLETLGLVGVSQFIELPANRHLCPKLKLRTKDWYKINVVKSTWKICNDKKFWTQYITWIFKNPEQPLARLARNCTNRKKKEHDDFFFESCVVDIRKMIHKVIDYCALPENFKLAADAQIAQELHDLQLFTESVTEKINAPETPDTVSENEKQRK